MADVQAFRALRYNLGHVGSLSDVIAPPYDVISPELQEHLYKRHPANVVRLILNREEPGDDDRDNRYARAARFLRNWESEGVLYREPDPALYVYHQVFEHAGHKFTRRGFMGQVRLERFGEGRIYPHEETMSGPKQDRLLLTRACRANLSQIFGLYPDEGNEAQEILERAIAGQPPVEATDHLGVVHQMWAVTDPKIVVQVAGAMGPKPIFIADGHHRYETACNYRDELQAVGTLDANHPANFVLMMCVGMSDPGMVVLPTHRLFRGIDGLDADALARKLAPSFSTRQVGQGQARAPEVWDEIESMGEQGTIGLYTTLDKRWTLATVTKEGRARMQQVAGEHSADWQQLGVALLHRLIVEQLLGAKDLPKPTYVHLVRELVDELDTGQYGLAALVMPATLGHIESISKHLERMPAKSTYFYPKLLSGLVIRPLD